jgi:hypothetical protein
MKEASVGYDQPLITHHQTAEMAKPRECALHNPPPTIAPQLAAVLVRRVLVVPSRGDDRLDPPTGQAGPQGIAVIAPIGDQPLGPLAGPAGFPGTPDRDRVERPFEEGDFRRGRRVQVCSQRSTRAIDQHHPLRALAALGNADFRPPFLAGMKLPSAKHSSQRSFCWSLSWARKARHSLSSTPVSSHCLSRRQQVEGLPYRRGSSLHWAPVQRIQRIPSKQRRSGRRGRPPRADGFDWGRWTRMAAQCAFVSPRHAMSRPPIFPGDSWRYDTSSVRF